MKKLMFKVTRIDNGNLVMFESKADAEQYIKVLDLLGIKACLNKWSWETEIED